MVSCIFCGKPVKTLIGLKHHVRKSHFNGECPVCGKKANSKGMRPHFVHKGKRDTIHWLLGAIAPGRICKRVNYRKRKRKDRLLWQYMDKLRGRPMSLRALRGF